MAFEPYIPTLVVFNEGRAEIASTAGVITEIGDPNSEISGTSLLSGDCSLDIPSTSEAESPTPQALWPETRSLHEYEDPLSHELIEAQYLDVISAQTDRAFLDVVPGSEEHEAVRRQAKKEITQELLWKMGLASEYIRFLDIDVVETRDLLTSLYREIPEEIDRDNNPNSYHRRKELVEAHIIEASGFPEDEAKQKLQDTKDVWLGDLALRYGIMVNNSEPEPPADPLEQKRAELVDELLHCRSNPTQIIGNILNTLMPEDDQVKEDFYHHVSTIRSEDPTVCSALEALSTAIESYHLPND